MRSLVTMRATCGSPAREGMIMRHALHDYRFAATSTDSYCSSPTSKHRTSQALLAISLSDSKDTSSTPNISNESTSPTDLQNNTGILWEAEGQKPLAAALNPLLRTYFNPRLGVAVDIYHHAPLMNKVRSILQVDHFLEIQHVVRLINLHEQRTGGREHTCDLSVGNFLRLSQFLNHEYTSITSQPRRTDTNLLSGSSCTYQGRDSHLNTVRTGIHELTAAMRDATGEYAELSKVAGRLLHDYFSPAVPTLRGIVNVGGYQRR